MNKVEIEQLKSDIAKMPYEEQLKAISENLDVLDWKRQKKPSENAVKSVSTPWGSALVDSQGRII